MKDVAYLALQNGISLAVQHYCNDELSCHRDLRSQSTNSCYIESFASLRDLAISNMHKALKGWPAMHRCTQMKAPNSLFNTLTSFHEEI